MRCCHVRKKAYLKKMTRIKFNLKKSYGVFGDILFQTATRLLKKKAIHCIVWQGKHCLTVVGYVK